MSTRPFKQVDVFTATPYLGNPLAVVLDGSELTTESMQHFAQWTHLSETTFILPPSVAGADYRVRIFTPEAELPFAGHPTLGSCHAWIQAGGTPKNGDEIVQECAIGLIRIRREGTRLVFAAPPLQRSLPEAAQLAQVAEALGLKARQIVAAQLLDNGPLWLGLLLDSPQTVLELTPDHPALKQIGIKVGVAGIEPEQAANNLIARSNREARAFGNRANNASDLTALDASELEVRAFAAPLGVLEDPVTGSLNASLAQWLIAEDHLPKRYIAAQGTCMSRAGRVHLSQDDTGQVWVGGDVVTCIDGQVEL
jgi:PhzF family phenazine biosynthesis protein